MKMNHNQQKLWFAEATQKLNIKMETSKLQSATMTMANTINRATESINH